MADACLSALDASFLFMDTPSTPMQVAGLVLLDSAQRRRGPLTVGELRGLVRARLVRLPRFRLRPKFDRFGLGRPHWDPVDHLDWNSHVLNVVLPDGRWESLLELCAKLAEKPLRRDRPLWDLRLVDGLQDGRQAFVLRAHHAISDGVGAMGIASLLFDGGFATAPAPHLQAAAGGGWFEALKVAGGLVHYLAGGPVPGPADTVGTVGPRRDFATADLRLRELMEVKERLGGTLDDVLLATVAGALSVVGTGGSRARARAMVPVSTRPAGSGADAGNSVTAVFIDLPLDLGPVATLERIWAVKSVTRAAHEALGLSALVQAGGLLPAPLHALVLHAVASQPFAHLVVSDIPGPRGPVSLLGAPVLAAYPVMPLAPSCGLAVAAVTVGETVGVGVTSDPGLFPHSAALADAIETAFLRLRRATALPHAV